MTAMRCSTWTDADMPSVVKHTIQLACIKSMATTLCYDRISVSTEKGYTFQTYENIFTCVRRIKMTMNESSRSQDVRASCANSLAQKTLRSSNEP